MKSELFGLRLLVAGVNRGGSQESRACQGGGSQNCAALDPKFFLIIPEETMDVEHSEEERVEEVRILRGTQR